MTHGPFVLFDREELFLTIAVAAHKFIHTAGSVDKFLFAGEERMAFGANFNLEITLCGLSLDNFAASASNGCVNVVRMDSCFHYLHLTFR